MLQEKSHQVGVYSPDMHVYNLASRSMQPLKQAKNPGIIHFTSKQLAKTRWDQYHSASMLAPVPVEGDLPPKLHVLQ